PSNLFPHVRSELNHTGIRMPHLMQYGILCATTFRRQSSMLPDSSARGTSGTASRDPAALLLPGESFLSGSCAWSVPIPRIDALNRAAHFLSASVGSFADPPRNRRFPSGNVMFLPTAIFPPSLA